MSTNHHDSIPNNAPANADTFNDPLGQLDGAITAERNERVNAITAERNERIQTDNRIEETANYAKYTADNVDEYAKTTRNYHLVEEANERAAEDSRLENLIANEILNRISALNLEAAFREQMDDLEAQHREQGDNALRAFANAIQGDLGREAGYREQGDRGLSDRLQNLFDFANAIQGDLGREAGHREQGDNALWAFANAIQGGLGQEAGYREQGDSALWAFANAIQGDLGREAGYREQGDRGLSDRLQNLFDFANAIQRDLGQEAGYREQSDNALRAIIEPPSQSFWPDNIAELNLHNLRNWNSKIAQVQVGAWGRASIAFFGNSTDFVVAPIRIAAGGAVGFVSAAQGPRKGQAVGWDVQGEWIAEEGYGLDGMQARTVDDDTPARIVASAVFRACQIHFLRHVQGGRFRIRSGAGAWEQIDTAHDNDAHGAFVLSGANLTTENVEIEILTAPAGCSVIILGLAFFNDSPLVAHNAMSPTMSSARFRALSMNSVFMDMLVALDIDVSVFSFFDIDIEDDIVLYSENLLFAGWRVMTRQSDPLYLLPSESSNEQASKAMQKALREQLYENRALPASAIDLSLYFGRYVKSAYRGLWQDNSLSKAGGQLIANLLMRAFGVIQEITPLTLPGIDELEALMSDIEATLIEVEENIKDNNYGTNS